MCMTIILLRYIVDMKCFFLYLCNEFCRIELTLFSHVQQVYLKERCPLPPIALLWSSNCHPRAKQWPTLYISRMQHYRSFTMYKRDYVDLNDDWKCTFVYFFFLFVFFFPFFFMRYFANISLISDWFEWWWWRLWIP